MRKTVVMILSIAILCSLFVGVFAVTNSNTEDMSTPLANPFEYAKAPDGLDAFIYHGYSPYSNLNLDTSECVLDKLYVYNSVDDSLVAISEQVVTAYTCTRTALYYVTEEQKIYKTDYSGTNHEYLYQCAQGDIDNLSSYFDTLYFIENRTSIMLLDVASKTAQAIWTYENLSWVIMLNTDQLIATTAEEDDYLYDISKNTVTLISDIEATNLITTAVIGTSSNNARATTLNFATMVTQENDVSFPIEPYWATPDNNYSKVDGYYYSPPSSWFHNNGQEGCSTQNCTRYSGSGECMGFAKYVHDVYAHMGDDTYVDSNNNGSMDGSENYLANIAWEDRTCITYHRPPAKAFADGILPSNIDTSLTEKVFDDDIDEIFGFFGTLKTGAYVRYGKYSDKDSTPANGCHSIVFIAKDDIGVWVYECNQAYDGNSNHGCGVFIQYYTYQNLKNYKFVLNYVSHDFEEAPVYDGRTYHKVGCSHCVGYLRQKHDVASATFLTPFLHHATLNCCNGRTVDDAHTGTLMCDPYYSRTQHKYSATCCSGYLIEDHTFVLDSNGRHVCSVCGYGSGMIIMGMEQMPVSK